MSNTIGTIIRALGILMTLVAGWFFTVTAGYAVTVFALKIPFSWAEAAMLFGVVIVIRMFYPRNVFAG